MNAPDMFPAVPGGIDLDALYAPPNERITKAVFDRLVDVHEAYLKAATFFCLATASADGLDASPRGGSPGFVRVLDQHTVAWADWPGNNRIESLRNLAHDERVGMLFLFPGLDMFMRINGHARASTWPELLATLSEGGKVPKSATVVRLNEVLFHCGKAVNRAKLWDEAGRVDPAGVPSMGLIATRLMGMSEQEAAPMAAHYAHAVRHDLY